jgi:two-component system, OmpR family, sensor kinase
MKKLIEKTNQQFLVVLVILLSLSSVIIFLLLNRYIKDELDEKLRNDEWRIIEKLKENPHIISISPIIEVDTTNITLENEGEIKNVMVYDFIEKEKEPYRELVSIKKINNTFYRIQVRQSTIENKDMLFAIGITLFSVFALLVVILFYINNRLSVRLWKPFNRNIEALKSYSFKENKPIALQSSDVEEFQQLNESLEELTSKLSKDYIALKEFTENASHEIQTPLSIILLNIEAVLQS